MEDAKLYAVNNYVQRNDAETILAEFSSQFTWSENENVLDIGCGPGDVTVEILLPHLPKHATLVGADISTNMIDFANEKYGNENISFKAIDFGSSDVKKHFPEKHFSKIFSSHCLHWIQDQNQLGQNLFHLMQPGGEFLGVFTPSSQLFLALKLLSEFDEFKQYCKDVDSFIPPLFFSQKPAEDYKNILTTQGLEVVVCEERLIPVTYPNIEAMKKSFEAFNPFVKRMPEAVKEEYLGYFGELVRERIPISESGEIHFENPVIVVFARRPALTWAQLDKCACKHTCSGMH